MLQLFTDFAPPKKAKKAAKKKRKKAAKKAAKKKRKKATKKKRKKATKKKPTKKKGRKKKKPAPLGRKARPELRALLKMGDSLYDPKAGVLLDRRATPAERHRQARNMGRSIKVADYPRPVLVI